MSRFMLVIMSALAEPERRLIRERTLPGVRAAAAGRRSARIIGYR
ncbi:MAG: recombinase family protein [Bryobacteraceae bacterium]